MSISKLTAFVAIPRFARAKVRAFVKMQPEWADWCVFHGIVSRNASNSQLLEFAIQQGLDAQVLSILNSVPGTPAPAAPKAFVDLVDETECMNTEAYLASLETGDAPHPVAPSMVALAGSTSVDAILAGVEQFLSPVVKAELVKALAPVVAAANKPAEIIVQAAAPVAPQGELPYAVKLPGTVTLGQLFGIRGNHAKKVVHQWESHGAAPAIDPFYVIDAFNMAVLATTLDNGGNVWLCGPAGSGKTTMPEQFCAYTGRPFVKLPAFTRNTHTDDLVGGQGVKGGDSGWEDGVLLQAMQRPGTVILLDEITLAPAGVQGLFQGVADEHRTYTRPNGQKVKAAHGVVFVVADNTNGSGDESGLYQGTNQSNAALVNRFDSMVEVHYLTAQQEANALHNHTGAPKGACLHLAEFVARARKLPEMEAVVLSLRNMTAFVKKVQAGFTPKEAAQVTMLTRLPLAERAALETLFTLTWDGEFAALMSGAVMVTPPVDAASVAADAAFDDDMVF